MCVRQEWGVDLSKELVPSAATTAYVQFLERVASSEVRMACALHWHA